MSPLEGKPASSFKPLAYTDSHLRDKFDHFTSVLKKKLQYFT